MHILWTTYTLVTRPPSECQNLAPMLQNSVPMPQNSFLMPQNHSSDASEFTSDVPELISDASELNSVASEPGSEGSEHGSDALELSSAASSKHPGYDYPLMHFMNVRNPCWTYVSAGGWGDENNNRNRTLPHQTPSQ